MNRHGYKKKLKEIRIEIKALEEKFKKGGGTVLQKKIKYKTKNFMKYKRKLDNLPKKERKGLRRK